MNSEKKIISEIQSKKKHLGGILGQYRHLLVEMKRRYFTQKEMVEMLDKMGVKITQQSVSDYLIKMPITREELNGKNESEGIDLNQWKNKRPAKKSRSKKPVFFDISKPFK